MREWWVEEGIGEHRAVLHENDRPVAAKIDWPGELTAGAVIEAVFARRSNVEGYGFARLDDGFEATIAKLPRSASEGSRMRFEVVRAPIRESGRTKPARLVPTEKACQSAPSLRERLGGRLVAGFGRDVWEEIRADAWRGEMSFPGGSLQLSPTPAMTLIDIDGELPPRQLALVAAGWVGKAIRYMDLSGSIGIDFPTLQRREERKAVDAALADALGNWKHERTAMNGFGFVQIVARMESPSLLHRFSFDREGAGARWALRLAEKHGGGAGVLLIRAHPRIIARLREDWLEELRRRTGRSLRIEGDPALALDAPQVQIVER